MDKIPITCPHCTNKDQSMIEVTVYRKGTSVPKVFRCDVCSKTWEIDLRESLLKDVNHADGKN